MWEAIIWLYYALVLPPLGKWHRTLSKMMAKEIRSGKRLGILPRGT